MKYLGSCLCGNIQYEVDGEFENFFLCHCKSCRKDTGSAHAANLFSSTAKLKWLKGEGEVKTFNYQNSGHIKAFCPNCSSALPNIQMDGTLLVVPAGSLDTDIDITPSGHIYLNEKAAWDNNLELAPKFEELPVDNSE
ncbi:GFA family protein [Oceanispirochaeta crateris]|uniref:GFA family protein n=1 Tax=Oceanispirochaeta crateris TaxID=2518645 RepID=A0A5C1QLH4_9SPIO|nr:GFA family protein [Oceanispirochaeta crateris]QEN08178.1 GFA family protein [Oceanispirochaeta crateris]